MNNFLSQIRRSAKKRTILGMTSLLYVGYLGAILFCHCLEGGSHHGDNHQAHAKQVAEHSRSHEHSHQHSDSQPSTPHSCDCPEIESAILVSSSLPALVKHDCVVLLAIAPFSETALPTFSPLQFISSNHHGPPGQVPIHIKNQVFLI